MVTNVTSLTGNGLRDWVIQRGTAVYLLIYSVFLFVYLLSYSPINYMHWHELFQYGWFQIGSLIALLSLSLHAWIGIWTVTTDYIPSTAVRIIIQMLVAFWLLAQFVWGLMIVWGQ